MTEDEIRHLIRERALPYARGRAGSTGVTAWGIAKGLNGGGLCRFMTGKRPPGADVLRTLGLEWGIARDETAWIGSSGAAVTENEIRDIVRKRAAPFAGHWPGSTGMTAWAAAHGVHNSALSLFMAAKGPPGSDLLDTLGLEWRIFEQQHCARVPTAGTSALECAPSSGAKGETVGRRDQVQSS